MTIMHLIIYPWGLSANYVQLASGGKGRFAVCRWSCWSQICCCTLLLNSDFNADVWIWMTLINIRLLIRTVASRAANPGGGNHPASDEGYNDKVLKEHQPYPWFLLYYLLIKVKMTILSFLNKCQSKDLLSTHPMRRHSVAELIPLCYTTLLLSKNY